MVDFLRGGESNTPVVYPQQTQGNITPPLTASLLDTLQSPAGEGTKRFCVDLPISMHTRLTALAHRVGRPKTEVIKFLIEQALTQVETQKD
jgi:hypothetical protein